MHLLVNDILRYGETLFQNKTYVGLLSVHRNEKLCMHKHYKQQHNAQQNKEHDLAINDETSTYAPTSQRRLNFTPTVM